MASILDRYGIKEVADHQNLSWKKIPSFPFCQSPVSASLASGLGLCHVLGDAGGDESSGDESGR